MHRSLANLLIALSLALAAPVVAAQAELPDPHAHEVAAPSEHVEPGAHAATGGHDDAHVPHFEDVNWYYGLFGEQEGVEPDLLFRPKGMPVPVLALVINTLVLFLLLYRVLGRPISDGLKRRKENILRGMEEAAKMKRDAEAQLSAYEDKLAKVDLEVSRIRNEMRQAAETESARILSEAKERRTRMERDARQLIEQELKAVREKLIQDTISGAMKSAEASLAQKITSDDQQRFGESYLKQVQAAGDTLRGRL
jgi:F-type H+-transporting ATPase subunit b